MLRAASIEARPELDADNARVADEATRVGEDDAADGEEPVGAVAAGRHAQARVLDLGRVVAEAGGKAELAGGERGDIGFETLPDRLLRIDERGDVARAADRRQLLVLHVEPVDADIEARAPVEQV